MIQVGFSHARGLALLPRLIMAVTRRPFSHCWMLCTGEHGYHGHDVVMEAAQEGFRLVPYAGYQVGNAIVEVVTPPYPLDPALDLAIDCLGGKYDDLGLVGMGWVIFVRRWLHKKAKNPLASAHAMWCSEAIGLFMSRVPAYLLDERDVTSLDPGDIRDLLAGKTVKG